MAKKEHTPFGRHVFEQRTVGHVDLRAQRSREHELTNRAREPIPAHHIQSAPSLLPHDACMNDAPGEKSIERETRHEHAVYELDHARQDEKEEEGIDEFEAGGRRVEVCAPEGPHCRRRRGVCC